MAQPADQDSNRDVRFVCDAMLGGLARWLRAAGYSAEFDVHFSDGEIVSKAFAEGTILLTSDSGIMQRYAVSRGLASAIFVPLGLSVIGQLAHVLAVLSLPLRQSRCMDCNGELRQVPLEEVADRVPKKVRLLCKAFFVCERCGKLLWHGTHWSSIRRRLGRAQRMAASASNRKHTGLERT